MLFLKLAGRNILRQKRRSILTALSIAGGYVLVTLSLSLVNGSYGKVIEFFIRDRTGHVQIHKEDYLTKPRLYKNFDPYTHLYEALRNEPEIVAVTARIRGQALAFSASDNTPVQVTGVDPFTESNFSTLKEKVHKGRYFKTAPDDEGYYEAMIGYSVASLLHLKPGDEIVLLSQGVDGSMANDLFRVTGIVGTKSSRDRLEVYLPMEAAQSFFSMQGKINEVALLIDDTDQARNIALILQEKVKDNLIVSPWQKVEETFYKTMEADKRGDRVMLGIIIFIVFVGVLNTIFMSVLERTREFGVLKAIGTRPTNLVFLITTETVILSLTSCFFGLLISYPLIAWFAGTGIPLSQPIDVGGVAFTHLKGELSLSTFMIPYFVLCSSAIMVSIPPGIRAARILPLDALRSY